MVKQWLMVLLVAAALCEVSQTQAQSLAWTRDGIPVAPSTGFQRDHQIAAWSDGATLIVWRDDRNGVSRIFAQALDSDGVCLSQWPPLGIALSPPNTTADMPRLVVTSDTTALVAWRDTRSGASRVYIQQLEPSGPLSSRFAAFGALAQDSALDTAPIAVARDSGLGCLILSQRAQFGIPFVWHFSGVLLTDSVAAISSHPIGDPIQPSYATAMTATGGGTAIALYAQADAAQFSYYLRRLTSAGTVDTTWGPAGAVLATFPSPKTQGVLCADNSGGVFAAWIDRRGGTYHAYVTRVREDGAIAPGWNPQGTVIGSPLASTFDQRPYIAAPDSSALNAVLQRSEGGNSGDVIAFSFSGVGSSTAGWPSSGVRVSSGSSFLIGGQTLQADPLGGCYLAWHELALGDPGNPKTWLQRLTAGGVPAPGWPIEGVQLSTSPAAHTFPRLTITSADNCVVLWQDQPGSNLLLYAGKVTPDGTVPVAELAGQYRLGLEGAEVEWRGNTLGLVCPEVATNSPEAGHFIEGTYSAVRVWDGVRAFIRRPSGATTTRCVLRDSCAQSPWHASPITISWNNGGGPVDARAFGLLGGPTAHTRLLITPRDMSSGPPRLRLFDPAGRLVQVMSPVAQSDEPWIYRVELAPSLPAGIFLLEVRVSDARAWTSKLVILK